jgi:hypothetical protein
MVWVVHPGSPFRATIRPIHLHYAQLLAATAPPLADGACSSLIGQRGRGDHNEEYQSSCVSKDLALATLPFLAVITSSLRPSHVGGFDRLALETPRRGMLVLRLWCADARASRLVDTYPYPRAFLGAQGMRDALPRGKIGGQPPPLAPAFGDIKNSLEHSPHAPGVRASATFGGGDQRCDLLPCFVGQVAWICLFIHSSMPHNPRRLFRQALRRILVPSMVESVTESLSR